MRTGTALVMKNRLLLLHTVPLHIQLLDAGNYAREKGIIFKGDIPIGISRNSVEAWIEPYYFNMNGQAGAPPDAFSVNGQNWAFPPIIGR